jgi:hypothetical protein
MKMTGFCDLECKYARFPKFDAVDRSGSCQPFVALLAQEKARAQEPAVQGQSQQKMMERLTGNERPIMTFYRSWQKMP